ncbi:MAG: crotonase/enoyl-CoA hydratase family protein [Rudaea sp.]|nr:crotonase/enoyl-CoA hydratase family protein [Rudaea sp.]
MAFTEVVTQLHPSRVTANFRNTQHKTLWITMAKALDGRSQNFSLDLLHDMYALHKSIQDSGGTWVFNGATQPVNYVVLKSANPDYFSLGGDLGHFRECIRQKNKKALSHYSMLCVDMIYDWSAHLSRHATTIALVQGRALGGGFEAALASDYLIAEEQSEFGFPEILFGLFPCTGGMSLLSRRVGVYQAERMMTNGKIYSAAELKEMGVVDELCPAGHGTAATEKFIATHYRHQAARLALQRGRHRLAPLNYEELRTVVEEWVEAAMGLGEDDLRVMEMLVQMQQARVAS